VWDNPGGELVGRIIGELQSLTNITYWFYPKLPRMDPCCAQFTFDSESFWVVVRGEDDTVEILSSSPREKLISDQAHLTSLTSRLRGMRMAWARMMVNQQGYLDGFQADFESGDHKTLFGIELIAAASCFQVRLCRREGSAAE
jgi:hypothetical protein